MSCLVSRRLVASRLCTISNSCCFSTLIDSRLHRWKQNDGTYGNEKSTKDWRCAAVSPPSQLSLSSSFRTFHSNTPILLAQREQRHRNYQSTHRGQGTSYNRNNFSQIQEHLHNFPSQLSTTKNSTALAAWHRTAMELVMDVSKLWGRHRQSNPTSPQQFYRAVLLANDLVSKVLSIRESELDEEVGGIELQSIQRDKNKPRFNSERKLTTELLAQTVALGFARCDPKISSDAAYKAQQLLDRLEEINIKHHRLKNKRNLSFKEQDVFPTARIYNHVLNCWSRSMISDAEKHATALLSRMASPRTEGVAFPRPDIFSYNNMLNLYASRGDASAVLDTEPPLSVEQVLPILNSIISSRGNVVRLFQFPWVWRKQQGISSESESDFDRFLDKCDENFRNRSCSCLNCNARLDWMFCNNPEDIWYGSQAHTCHQCLKKCCYEEDCKDENGENYSLALESCRMCLKDFCKECARMNYCAVCKDYYCERCVSVSHCADCNRSLCNATCRMNECKEGNNNCRGCIQLIAPNLLEKSKTLLEARLELKACVLKIQGVSNEVLEKQQLLIESSKAHFTDTYERNMKQIDLQDDLIQKSNDQFKECLKVAEAEYVSAAWRRIWDTSYLF